MASDYCKSRGKMLLFFIILYAARTLHGAPSPSNDGSQVADLTSREIDSAQSFRTGYSIVQSCFVTIFACVWTSAHPNIHGPRDSGWTRFKRRLTIMLVTTFTPELILWWALNQWMGAKAIAKQYNKEFCTTADSMGKEEKRSVLQWFHILPQSTTRRGKGQPWTTTHGFFIQMGGFILYENEYPKSILDYKKLESLIQLKQIDQPIVTEAELQDKSKGDAISKGIVFVQMAWFTVQCNARAKQHLILSELEVLTLAFAVMNAIIYAVWWNKPQGVDMAICVPLKAIEHIKDQQEVPEEQTKTDVQEGDQERDDVDMTAADTEEEKTEDESSAMIPTSDTIDTSFAIFDIPSHFDHPEKKLPIDDYADAKQSSDWIRQKISHAEGILQKMIMVPYVLVGTILHITDKITSRENYPVTERQFRVPMFFSDLNESDDWAGPGISILVAILFGGVHLFGWGEPSIWSLDLYIWRISALTVSGVPFLFMLVGMSSTVIPDRFQLFVFVPCAVIGGLAYPIARFMLIFVAIRTIRNPAPEVLLDVNWTTYIPHF